MDFLAKTGPTLLLLLVTAVGIGGSATAKRRSAFRTFPRVTFWAWERPEDLRSLDVQRYGIAYLDQTIFITDQVSSRPRMQRLLVPPAAKVMAVVRIEAPAQSAMVEAPSLASTVADLIVRSARNPGISALQIDFDAVQSQRGFYASLLREVRKRMPEEMPLSITALASWCAYDNWISNLPVDEAVPMFFRMGRDRHPSNRPGWSYPIREPLCMTSTGVSTDEPWPKIGSNQRVYVFHPSAWSEIALQNVERMVER